MDTSKPSNPASTTNNELEALLTESEYARLIKRSVASVRRDRVLGQGCAYVKLGALVRYRREDVRAYIELNLRKPQRRDPVLGANK